VSLPVITVLLGRRRRVRGGESLHSNLGAATRTCRTQQDPARHPDVLAEMAQVVLGSLNRLPDQERQVLVGTLRTWLACGGSAEDTAKALSCHPSTVRYRLNLALQPLLRRVTENELGCEPNTHRGSPRS
jgi:DNA-directed RNA polymerase specialized sigma24 family protein